jgi:hypothetical protein
MLDYAKRMERQREEPEQAANREKKDCGCERSAHLTGAADSASTRNCATSRGQRRRKRARKGATTHARNPSMAKRKARKAHSKAHAKTARRRGHVAKETPRKKRHASKAQLAALAKARRARRANLKKPGQKRHRVRAHSVAAHMSREAPAPRRRKARRKKASPAQLRALGKARRAHRANLRKPGHRRHRVKAYTSSRPQRRVRVKSHLSRETPRRRRSTRRRRASETQTRAQRKASLRNLSKARAARRRHRGGEARRHRRHHSRAMAHYESYAMENPLTGTEIFVGGLTGLLGFGVADVFDRFLATHALTSTGKTSTAGWTQYTDTPPTTATWRNPYANMFNAAAVIAPMGISRWGVGLLITAVPLVAARWVKAPVGRSALQFFAFGAGFRVVGKGLQDLFAYVFKKTSFGLRLYDGEVRAWAIKSGQLQFVAGTNDETGALQGSLPAAGLGVPLIGCGQCANCITGVGACVSRLPAARNHGENFPTAACQPGSRMWGSPGQWPPPAPCGVLTATPTPPSVVVLTPPPPPPFQGGGGGGGGGGFVPGGGGGGVPVGVPGGGGGGVPVGVPGGGGGGVPVGVPGGGGGGVPVGVQPGGGGGVVVGLQPTPAGGGGGGVVVGLQPTPQPGFPTFPISNQRPVIQPRVVSHHGQVQGIPNGFGGAPRRSQYRWGNSEWD